MPRLELAMLGPFRAVVDGDPIETFPYEKVRALLAYLAEESGRSHTRSALAALLWPEMLESAARQNLSQALSTLRRVLGENRGAQPFLLPTHQEIRFSPNTTTAFDEMNDPAIMEGTKDRWRDDATARTGPLGR